MAHAGGRPWVPELVVAWETTRACPLACIHCRAEAHHHPDPRQLTTAEGKALLADIAGMGQNTLVILTGGEPLTRPDIFELAAYGTSLGLYMTISPDYGHLLTKEAVEKLIAAGIKRVSFSLHYPDAAQSDYFARTPGFFEAAMQGLAHLRAGGLPFQINTTVTRHNAPDLPRLYELVLSLGAVSWDLFFLVPTGRARMMQSDELSPEDYEGILNWLYDLRQSSPIPVKQTCAPHFRRIERQREKGQGIGERGEGRGSTSPLTPNPSPLRLVSASRRHSATSRGCMAGNGFCFVSHIGDVCGCGYLPVVAGNVRERPFSEIYRTSPFFAALRDPGLLGGKCGACQYRIICGGCRARAYAVTGDYLAEEPYCIYQPTYATASSSGRGIHE